MVEIITIEQATEQILLGTGFRTVGGGDYSYGHGRGYGHGNGYGYGYGDGCGHGSGYDWGGSFDDGGSIRRSI